MNEQTLELQIKSKAQEAKSSVESLVKSLTNVENVLTNIYLELGSIEKKSNVEKTTKQVDTLKSSADKATTSVNKLGKALSLGGTYIGAKKLTMQMLSWMNEPVDFTEQLNLFNVVFDNVKKNGVQTFSELGRSATKFQYKLNEAFGTNKTQSLYMQGIYQSMGETVGIPENYASIISENTTKLTYDLASLFNKSEKTTAEALRAGVFAGQTKPLRAYGIDVTQQSLQPILDSLGINKQVKEMSQAEKEILRYLATLKQAQIAMGDLANTIESPSNQLKIFRQQLVETKVAVSNLFMGLYSNVLPYANAFLMIVKEISKAIADMFGIELTDYNSGIASQEGIYDGIEESADNANKAVKELKRQVLGFDEIHNINENKDNGNGTNLTGGIDQRLLDSIHGYDNGMESVRMKATQIRDNIMDWLGFTKEIDPLTGEVSFKLGKGYSNLKLIGGIVATLIGYKLFKGLTNIAKGILGVDNLLALSGKNLTTIGKLTKSLKVSGWSATITKITTKLNPILPIIGKITLGVGGLATAILGSTGAYNAMKQMTIQTEYGGKEFGKYTLGILETVGGATTLGTVLGGPLGAAIGGLTGTVVAGISALLGYKQGIQELAKEDLFGTISVSTSNWKEMLDNLNISINDSTGRFETLKNNLLTLGTTFEENSNKLDFYGLKFGTLAQKITEEDSVNITNAIAEMCDSANSIIDETTTYSLELWGNTFERMSTITEEEEKDILKSILDYGNNQKEELKLAQDNITKTYENAIATRGYLTDEEYKYISEQLKKIRELTNKEMSISQTDIEYYKTLFADKNQKLDEESYSNYKKALDEYHNERLKAIEETYNQELNSAKNLYNKGAISQQQYNDLINTAYVQRNKDIILLDSELEKYTDKVIDSLKIRYGKLLDDNTKLGKEQKKIIENIFKNLNVDVSEVKREFENAGKTCAVNFSNNLSKNLKVNGSNLYSSWNSTLSKFDTKFSNNNLGLNNPFSQFKINANGGIYSNGTWKNIKQYANGGAPSHGSMFVAGEHGAEIVGHINGKTEVLNQSQIANAIYSAVYSAMSQFNGGGIAEINVRADKGTIVETAINGINQQTRQTGVCPITIPVS